MTDNTQELSEIIREMRYRVLEDNGLTVNGLTTIEQETKQAVIDWHNKQIEAYHNELTDNDKKVWIYADDLEKRKAKAVEEVLDRLLVEVRRAYDKEGDFLEMVVDTIEAERNKLKESTNE